MKNKEDMVHMYVLGRFPHVWLLATLWTVAHQAPLSMDSPGRNTGVDCCALLQGIFPTQGLNLHLLSLPALADEFFTPSTTWEAPSTYIYSPSKKNDILPFVATLLNLEGIMWSEVSQTEKENYCVISLLLLLSCFSHVRLCATPETAAHQAPPSLGFSRQEHWSGLPFPSPMHESEKWKWSRSVVSDSSQPHGLQPTRLLRPWDFPCKSTGVGCHCLLCHMYLELV